MTYVLRLVCSCDVTAEIYLAIKMFWPPLSCSPCSVQQPTGPGEEDGVGETGWGGGHPEEGRVGFGPGPAAGRCPLHHQTAGREGGPGEKLHEERLCPDHMVRNHHRVESDQEMHTVYFVFHHHQKYFIYDFFLHKYTHNRRLPKKYFSLLKETDNTTTIQLFYFFMKWKMFHSLLWFVSIMSLINFSPP